MAALSDSSPFSPKSDMPNEPTPLVMRD